MRGKCGENEGKMRGKMRGKLGENEGKNEGGFALGNEGKKSLYGIWTLKKNCSV